MKNEKIISVIIPIYNSGEKAINAINSVRSQEGDYKFEIVLVDDFSTDNSIEFLRKNIDAEIDFSIIQHSKNEGAGAARKTGIDNAKGDFIAFLDSDDTWAQEKTSKQMEIFNNSSEVAMVGCLTNMPGSFPPLGKSKLKNISVSLYQQCFKNYFQTSTVIIKSKILKNIITWPISRYGDEGTVFLKIANIYPIVLLNEILVNYSNGKKGFGFSGVSANLREMQKAEINNLKIAYHLHENILIYSTSIIFSYLKYFVRIIRTKI